MLHLYNTASQTKEELRPLNKDHVGIYVCGPTVYGFHHIGNYRPAVVFDILVRYLRVLYPRVTYVRNLTDIDDKINNKAAAEGVDIAEISHRYTESYHQDLEALGVLPPDIEPRVTGHLDEIQAMIQRLLDDGYAYEAEGHVLFNVESYTDYGALSGRKSEEMMAGARVEVAAYKKNPGDFVLWKPSSDDQPGWPSPWGRGRPGWHIECSAMIEAHLGETIDIHGGGQDLIFPHHENERAQSVCSHQGAEFVKLWMHNGFVSFKEEKMSKSLGNIQLLRELRQQAPAEAIRYALLSAHYRAPLDWNDNILTQAQNNLDRLYGALRGAEGLEQVEFESDETSNEFFQALDDDLNTPQALSILFKLAKRLNVVEESESRQKIYAQLKYCAGFLGLLESSPNDWFEQGDSELSKEAIDDLIEQRLEAKRNKNWQRADQIRDQLRDAGIALEDVGAKSRWRYEK